MNEQINTSKTRIIWEIAKGVLFVLLAIPFLFLISPPIVILLFIAFIVLRKSFHPSSKDIFLRLQATLPTSKIRSVAMGLIEIKGKSQEIDFLCSKINEKDCIGYKYTIENISTEDGNVSYSQCFSETVCNPFKMKDETGEVMVTGEEIDLVSFPIDKRYESNGRRYTQYLLNSKQDVLLIGKANSKENITFIERETIKDVFSISPIEEVSKWNMAKPLRASVFTFFIVLFALIALILLTDIMVEDNRVLIQFSKLNLKFTFDDLYN